MSPVLKLCGVLAVFALAILANPINNEFDEGTLSQSKNHASTDHVNLRYGDDLEPGNEAGATYVRPRRQGKPSAAPELPAGPAGPAAPAPATTADPSAATTTAPSGSSLSSPNKILSFAALSMLIVKLFGIY